MWECLPQFHMYTYYRVLQPRALVVEYVLKFKKNGLAFTNHISYVNWSPNNTMHFNVAKKFVKGMIQGIVEAVLKFKTQSRLLDVYVILNFVYYLKHSRQICVIESLKV